MKNFKTVLFILAALLSYETYGMENSEILDTRGDISSTSSETIERVASVQDVVELLAPVDKPVVAAPLFPTDAEIEAHGEEMKRAYDEAFSKATDWVDGLVEENGQAIGPERRDWFIKRFVTIKEEAWEECTKAVGETGRFSVDMDSLDRVNLDAGLFSPFHSMEFIEGDISNAKIFLRAMAGIRVHFLPKDYSPTVQRPRTSEHTTLLLGCGRLGCENHRQGKNSHHYTVDMNAEMDPDIISDIAPQSFWDQLEGQTFKEIVAEAVGVSENIVFMRRFLTFLEPGGVFKTMHCSPHSHRKDGMQSPDADLFSGWREATGRPLLDISLGEFLIKHVGFERVEFKVPPEEQKDCYKSMLQLHAYKAR